MERTALPHQRPVLRWAKRRNAIGLFLQMRLGKTFIAIRWVKHRSPNGRVLCVAPLSVLPGWVEELEQENLSSVLLIGSAKRRAESLAANRKRCRWFLINPEGLRSFPALLDESWDVVILDESTFIRKPQTKIAKIVRRLRHVPNRAILTGLPNPESPLDYFEQLAFLGLPFMGCQTYWQYRARHFFQAGYRWRPKRGTLERLTHQVAKHCYVLSTKDAGLETPAVYETRHVSLPPGIRGIYRACVEEFRLGERETIWSPVVRTWLCQLCGGIVPLAYRDGRSFYFDHKLNELEKLLCGELKSEQVVVFFRFTRELSLALQRLRRRGIVSAAYAGLHSLEQRKRKVLAFRSGQTRVFLMQAKCARMGLDLSVADTVIFYSNWYDSQTREQCEARIEHPKKKRSRLYIDLVTKDTVDEDVLAALKQKDELSSSLLERIQERFCNLYEKGQR